MLVSGSSETLQQVGEGFNAQVTAQLAQLAEAAGEQREAVASLLGGSSDTLLQVGEAFNAQVGSQLQQLSGAAGEFTGSAAEMASLGEAFALAVNLFNESNEKLIDNLNRIEAALEKSTARSDEQMGYYVAQAREVIDHSVLTQKEIIDELRRSGEQRELLPAEAG